MSRKWSGLVVVLAVTWATGPAMAGDLGKGNILFEEWFDASITSLDTLQSFADYPDSPHGSHWATAWDRPDGGEDYWGCRSRGYLYPPQTGDYTFWVASDDYSIVWLSTDEDPANRVQICGVDGWMNYQDFAGSTGSPGTHFKSAAIPLEAGKRYYVETLMYDGTGGGAISVAWGGPGIGAGPVVVAGEYLAPWIRDPEPLLQATNPVPANGEVGVTMPVIQWTPGPVAAWHDVYFGTDPNPPYVTRIAFNGHFVGQLEDGATYYWRIDEVDADGAVVGVGSIWSFQALALNAFKPYPADGETGLPPGLILTWMAGRDATGQHLYLSEDPTAVAQGDASADRGSFEQTEFNTGGLRTSTTYYWRVDTITATGIVPGDVWSFTVQDADGPANKIMYEYWLGIDGTLISSLTGDARYPDSPDHAEYVDSIDSPVDWGDDYGQRFWGWLKPPQTGNYTFWVAGDDLQEFWLSSDASPINTSLICQVTGWTGARDFDGTTGSPGTQQKSSSIPLTAGEKYYFMVIGKEDGGGDSTSAAWQGPGIETRQIITSEYVDLFGLMPLQAFRPSPANGTVDTLHEITLSWSAGEQAEAHEIYLGTDANEVAAADTTSSLFLGRQTDVAFDTGELEWDTTYYWRVDEVTVEETRKGIVWFFTTANYLLIDDMESYTDEEGNRIYEFWMDGYSNLLSGSIVGYLNPPFTEQTIVHGGKQSMPFDYDNTKPPYYSEAEMTFSSPQDWTVEDVNALTLFVQGYPPFTEVAVTEVAGKMSVTGSGADIWGNSDEFTYIYKNLTGDGTLVARVVSIGAGANTWAKGGVMIRDSLNGGSAHAMMILTANSDGAAGNGACFQYRSEADATSTSIDSTSVIAPAYWVKIERMGDYLTGYTSSDGTNWSPMGTIAITMTDPVYIGLCVTSHQVGENRTYEFDNIASTGSVSGVWQGAAIDSPMHSSVQPLYATIIDSTGKTATVTRPAGTNAATWTPGQFPLADFGKVNLAKVETLILGVGDPDNPAPGGMGRIFIDDIRITRP